MKFDPTLNTPTALLNHASNRARAADNYDTSTTAIAVTSLINYHWFYVDYVTAYDPNTPNIENSAIMLEIVGASITELRLNGTLSLLQELPKNSFEEKESDFETLIAVGKKVAGYFNTWDSWKNKLREIKDRQTDPVLKANLENLLSTWTFNNLGLIGAAVGVLDFLITGGRSIRKESPVPIVFSGAFELSGTAETKKRVFQLSIQTPGTKHKFPNFIPLYDKPLGIFNLTKTPVLEYRRYWHQIDPNVSMEYYSYRVKDSILYAVNPYSELQVTNIEAAIVFRLNPVYRYPYSTLPGINDWLKQGIYEIESSTDGKYVLRTRYIPYEKFKNTVINVPPGTDVTIKIKAELRRINAPSDAQPILFVADYEPKLEFDSSATTPFPWSTYQLPLLPLTLNISGPTYLKPGETGTFTANPSGGSGTYINYKWWIRNDETSIEPYAYKSKRKSNLITPSAPPQGEWIYMSHWEGRQTVTTGPNYDFSLKCEVIDSHNNTAIDIHSVNVGGSSLSIEQPNTNNAATFSAVPTELTFEGIYPNPFNSTTAIRFGLPEAQHVSIKIYSITGQLIKTLVDDYLSEGYHQIIWDGLNQYDNEVSSGIYICEMRTRDKHFVKKILLAK